MLVISSFNDNNDVDHDAQQDEANHREAHYSFEVVTVICFRFADPVTEEEHVVAADKNDCFIVNFLSVHWIDCPGLDRNIVGQSDKGQQDVDSNLE